MPMCVLAQVNIKHQMLGREGNVIDGQDKEGTGSQGSSLGSISKIRDDMKAGELA